MLLTSNEMTEYLHSIAEGSTSTYPSLKPSDIEAVEFSMPPKDKLFQFSEFAKNNWDKIDYNQIQIKILEKTRDTLLPKLISGEIKVDFKEKIL
jgi:type I restriction enzyme S subunit